MKCGLDWECSFEDGGPKCGCGRQPKLVRFDKQQWPHSPFDCEKRN